MKQPQSHHQRAAPLIEVPIPASARRRLAAAAIDLAILWLVGEVLAALFLDQFLAMGRRGRLIGALFFLAYIGGQNSTLTQGRTFGKRLLRLRTVAVDGGFLSLERGIARAALLLLPLLTRGWFFFPESLPVAMAINGSCFTLTWGLGSALLWSYLRSGTSGRALHDGIFGTRVVVERSASPVSTTASARGGAPPTSEHRPAPRWLSLWLLLCASLGATLSYAWGGGQRWREVVQAQNAIEELEEVLRAEVYRGVFSWRGAQGEIAQTHFVQVSAFVREPLPDPEQQARVVAERALSKLGGELDALRVTIAWEFDLLLARRSWAHSFVRRPADWLTTGTTVKAPANHPHSQLRLTPKPPTSNSARSHLPRAALCLNTAAFAHGQGDPGGLPRCDSPVCGSSERGQARRPPLQNEGAANF